MGYFLFMLCELTAYQHNPNLFSVRGGFGFIVYFLTKTKIAVSEMDIAVIFCPFFISSVLQSHEAFFAAIISKNIR